MTEEPRHGISWSDLWVRTVELGQGAASLTKDTAQKLVNDLIRRGHVSEDEADSLVHRLLELGKEQRQHMEESIARGVEQTMQRMDLARRSDLEALHTRLAALEKIVLGRQLDEDFTSLSSVDMPEED